MTPHPTARSAGTRRRRLNLVVALGATTIALLAGAASLATASTFSKTDCPGTQSPPHSGPTHPGSPPNGNPPPKFPGFPGDPDDS